MAKIPPRITIIAARNQMSHNVITVLSNLARMLGSSFELHLVVGSDAIPQNIRSQYKVHICKVKGYDPGSIRYALRAAFFAARRIRPDLMMNIIDPHSLGLAAGIAGRIFKIPTVVRQTGDTFGEYAHSRSFTEQARKFVLYNILGGFAYYLARHIIVLGKYFQHEMINKGYADRKITVLPQPFDASPFKPATVDEKSTLRERLGLEPDKKIILFVGRISYMKGADRLHEIILEVTRHNNKIQFCLVGNGEYADSFRRYDSSSVYLPGPVPHGQVCDYYRTSDLLLFPSRAEGLPNTILEALSCHLPIAATPVGEIPNYVKHTFNEPYQFAKYIMRGNWESDPVPEWFDWDKQAENYRCFFHQVIQDAD